MFLRTKRYGQNPVFLGPIKPHHKKNFDTYKVLVSTCVSSCKGLTAAKGFITDGEEELFRTWKTELPKATHLRCIRPFQSNCKEKLCETGIREARSQKVFLDKVFRIPEKMDSIVDADNETEVKEQLRNAKEVLEEKEKELLKKKSSYRSLFPTKTKNDCENNEFESKTKGWNAYWLKW